MWSKRSFSTWVVFTALVLSSCSTTGASVPEDSVVADVDMVATDASRADGALDLGTGDSMGFDKLEAPDSVPQDLAPTPDLMLDVPEIPDVLLQDLAAPDGVADSDAPKPVDLMVDTKDLPSDTVSPPDTLEELSLVDVQEVSDLDQVDAAEEIVVPPACPAPEDSEGNVLSGTVYLDSDGSSDSLYQQSIGQADAPMAGVAVEILLPGQEWQQRTTCPDGAFAFGSLPEGRGICRLVVDEPYWPSTANAPKRFPEAIAEGEVTILTFGDSIPSFGAQPYFPDRLADLLAPFAVVHNLNVAVPGTATADWLPTTNRFKNTLLPLLPEADVIVVSLGGNDMNYWVGYDNLTFEEALQLAAEFPEVMEEVRDNLDVILGAVTQANPDADIVYFIYPNYAVSTYWKNLAPDYITLIGNALKNELGKVRKHFSRPGITLVDMLGATPLIDLDACLSDPLHLSETGTHIWARQLFMALGGFELSPDPLGTTRLYGVTLQQ